jgi:hypothetical protein
MKIAVHILAYDVNRFINVMLPNVGPWVDKIYIAYPPRPFGYIPNSRETRRNPTRIEDIVPGEFCDKIEIIKGDWLKEEDTRNECFERAKSEGFDWLLIQDADEFYVAESWERLRKTLRRSTTTEVFRTTWYQFWKSSHYVIEDCYGSIKDVNVGFAIRCLPHLHFVRARRSNATETVIIDEPCYHYGYVKSDEEMLDKVTSWSHSHQFNGALWHELKWKHWNLSTRHIGTAGSPLAWYRAIRFPLHQPDFAEHFALPVEENRVKPAHIRRKEAIYDRQAMIRARLREWRKEFVRNA